MTGHSSIRRTSQALALVHGAGVTTVTVPGVKLNGLLGQVNILAPAVVDGAATLTINLIDADGITVYTKGSLAAASKTADKLTTPLMLSGAYSVQVVFSANQTTNDSTTNVTLITQVS